MGRSIAGWKIGPEERDRLLARFPPRYERRVADHVTLRFGTDAEFRKTPNASGLIVPLVQWGVVMAVWLWLVVQESMEKRAARQAAQPAQTAGGSNAPNPPQSA